VDDNCTIQDRDALEARVIAAQAAYLEAFAAWQYAGTRYARATNAEDPASTRRLAEANAMAEANKERLRIAFSALMDDLGYVPSNSAGPVVLSEAYGCLDRIH